YQIKDDKAKAKEYFEKAIAADPKLAEAACNLGVLSFLDEPEKGLLLIKGALDKQPDNAHIKNIYENYLANKDKILEKRRVSVCVFTYDCSMIKETVKSVIDIADEFIVLSETADILTDEELSGKKLTIVTPDEKMSVAAKKNLMLQKASLDWIFLVKEGETIQKEDINALTELTKKKDIDMYYLNVAYSEIDPEVRISTTCYEPRLFRTGVDATFDEIIFNHVNFSGKSEFSDLTMKMPGAFTKQNPLFKLSAKMLEHELSLNPKNYYANYMVGKFLFATKDWEKAAKEFELAKNAEGLMSDENIGFGIENMYLRGNIYMGLKKPVKARDTFTDLLKIDKENIDAYFQLGNLICFNNNEDPKIGIEHFNKYFGLLDSAAGMKKRVLLSYHTKNSRDVAHYHQGILYQKAEMTDKAIDSFNKAVLANPNYILPYVGLANLAMGKDDTKGAKGYLQKASAIDDNNYPVHHQLAILSIKEKDFETAKNELNKCLKINKDSIESFSLLGRVHEETKNFDKAERCYRAIVDRQPQDKNAILKLGDILLKKEDTQGALRVFRDLLAMKPSFIPANISVGIVLIQMENYTEAETHFNKLMKEYPEVAEYVLYASKVAILKKNFGDALIYFDKLLVINPKSKGYVEEQKKALKDKGII
ncbi:tetratricopeptide repeat protein, partial [Thermodesulfobacteriota bacterium]